ncbi:MAG: hypothetical protein IAE79_06285 [Anaerolinea sp.]|nr:hypothetical protein [Anaerolinea sp.]
MMNRFKRLFLLGIAFLLVSSALVGCSGQGNQAADHSFAMAPLSDMPEMVHHAPVRVQQAYQFAVANPETLQQIPCYCGCGSMGHTSDYACFVADEAADGTLTFETHALGCSICVDIAHDTMRLLDKGQPVDEIFRYIDQTYSRFGPPTPLDSLMNEMQEGQ